MIDDEYDEGIEWMQNMALGFGHNNYVLWSWFECDVFPRVQSTLIHQQRVFNIEGMMNRWWRILCHTYMLQWTMNKMNHGQWD
jgi:hypothetical protein